MRSVVRVAQPLDETRAQGAVAPSVAGQSSERPHAVRVAQPLGETTAQGAVAASVAGQSSEHPHASMRTSARTSTRTSARKNPHIKRRDFDTQT